MLKKKTVLILLILLTQLPLLAKDRNIQIESGIERYFGYTKLQTGGKQTLPDGSTSTVPFPSEELISPLDVFMFFANFEITMYKRLKARVVLKTNFNSNAGTAQGSRWGFFYAQGYSGTSRDSLDISTESESVLRIGIIDGNLYFQLSSKKSGFNVGTGIGFLYHNLDYEMRKLKQQYPSYTQYSSNIPAIYSNSIYSQGQAATYKAEYFSPYLVISPQYNIRKIITVTGTIALSPYTYAKDEYDNILDAKIGKGKSSGFGILLSLSSMYRFKSNVFADLRLEYMRIMTDGEQELTRYRNTAEGAAGPIATVENELVCNYFSVGVGSGYLF